MTSPRREQRPCKHIGLVDQSPPETRNTYNTKRHGSHADLQVTRSSGGGGLRGCLAEPALDGEYDGRPADHLVAGENLDWKNTC